MKTSYIAFLRGINVGGHNVKMDYLRELFSQLGLDNVRSFIQTGNVFFESSESDTNELEKRIEQHLFGKLGYDVKTFVRSVGEIENMLKSMPFRGIDLTPDTRHVIMFTSIPLKPGVELPLMSPNGGYEIIGYSQKEAFVVIHLVSGRYDSNNFVEKQFNIQTTSRFYHTLEKVLLAAKATP